jgi:hypothetical protein
MWVWSIALTGPTLVVVEPPDVVIELPDVVVESPDSVVESHGTRKGCHYISAYSGAATARPRSPPFLPILE